MRPCKATVIIPTTGDRGPLLRYSVGSIRNQTEQDFEVHIVGDGVSDATRQAISRLQKEDPRIFFHDFPKHERRGEPYRHQVIQKTRGKNIFYLCDRDLMLPHHIEFISQLLEAFDFVSTTFIDVKRDRSLDINQWVGYFGPGSQVELLKRRVGSLSCIGHSRAMYDRLKFGWRTTPVGMPTDLYMWDQFMVHPACKPFSAARPTILYFQRGAYPGPPVEERAEELAFWSNVISSPQGVDQIFWAAFAGLLLDRINLRSSLDPQTQRRK
ncbi:MAG: glycosyltransferase family 2 protein [Aestuariivirga sp.]|nr:glycosyltransferase family 2 protein [Aestuariivirga sp.]